MWTYGKDDAGTSEAAFPRRSVETDKSTLEPRRIGQVWRRAGDLLYAQRCRGNYTVDTVRQSRARLDDRQTTTGD